MKWNRSYLVLLLPAVLAATPCIGQEADEAGASLEKILGVGSTLPALISSGAVQSRQTVVKAVYGATMLSGGALTGQIVNTGTLTQVAGTLRFRYSPEPADRLVVKLVNGTHEFQIKGVKGNMKAVSAEAFLDADHVLHYRHRVPGRFDLDVKVRNTGGKFSGSVEGTFTHEKRDYKTKLESSGSSSYQSGFGGFESRADYKLSGKVTAKDLHLDVDEHHSFIMVSQSRSVAHQATDVCNNRLKFGGDTFKWENARFIKAFRDGKPSYPHRDWKASGKILKNDKAFGTFKLSRKALPRDVKRKVRGLVLIQLVTEEKTLNLQSFNIY